jgi:DNA modification methylase
MNKIEINKIYCESNVDTMSRMIDDFVDYTLTSPPYNVFDAKNISGSTKYKEFKDSISQNDYFEEQKNLIQELLRVTKNHIFYNIQMVSGNKVALHKLIGHFAENIKEVIIWQKNGQPAVREKVFNSCFEYIIIFSKNEADRRVFNDANFERGTQSNVFKIKNSHLNPFANIHKAIMPLDIPRYFMKNFGKQDDIWYDPYMGTGTTAVGAIMEKKQFIGSEISQEYIDLSNKRLEPYLIQKTLF